MIRSTSIMVSASEAEPLYKITRPNALNIKTIWLKINNLASDKFAQENIEEAIIQTKYALDYIEAIDDSSAEALISLTNLARLYSYTNNLEMSVFYYKTTLLRLDNVLVSPNIFKSKLLLDLAHEYFRMLENERKNFIDERITELSKNNIKVEITQVIADYKISVIHDEKYIEAVNISKEALAFVGHFRDKTTIAALFSLDRLYNLAGNYLEAIICCQELLAISEQIYGSCDFSLSAYSSRISYYYKELGNQENASYYSKLASEACLAAH